MKFPGQALGSGFSGGNPRPGLNDVPIYSILGTAGAPASPGEWRVYATRWR
jgi:hypothetical protein